MEVTSVVQLALFGAVVTRPTYRALTAGRPARVQEWAAAHRLDVNAANEGGLASHLRRRGRWRAAGALVGLAFAILVPELEVGVYRAPRPGGNIGFVGFWSVAMGYLAGVLAGELTRRRPPGPARRAASLAPRDLDEYVPAVARLWLVAGAAGAVAGGAALLLLPMHDHSTVGRAVVAVVPPTVAVLFALAAPLLARMLLHRAQPVATPLEVATDDAIRAAGARAVVAAGVAIVFVSLAVELFALILTDVQVLRYGAWLPSLGAFGFGYGAWRILARPGGGRARPVLRERPA